MTAKIVEVSKDKIIIQCDDYDEADMRAAQLGRDAFELDRVEGWIVGVLGRQIILRRVEPTNADKVMAVLAAWHIK